MAATPLIADLHPLLTEYVVRKLAKQRLVTVYSFVRVETEQLTKITNLPAGNIEQLKNELVERFAGRCRNGLAYKGERSVPLSTGIPAINDLLQGGLLPGHIYELCGVSGAGKTQLCMTIAANIALDNRRPVFYIDTKCDFSGTKIHQILENGKRNLTDQQLGHTMARIKIERIFAPDLLVQTVEELAAGEHFDPKGEPILMIVDSLPSLWYLFQDAKSSCEPLGPLTKLICSLRKLATEYDVAIVLVNLTVQWNDGAIEGKRRRLCPNGIYPALGRYWESAPGTRLLVQNEHNGMRSVTVWKSNHIRSGERTLVRITDRGVG